MLSSTSFKNIIIRAKIKEAMHRCLAFKNPQSVRNNKGRLFLIVTRVPGNVLRCFRFLTITEIDVTETVYRGLKL